MFLIGAFIIAISLILLKMNIKSPGIEEQISLMDIVMENSITSNLMHELENSAKFSVDQEDSIATNVFDFANFTERKAGEHGLEFSFLFVGSYANVTSTYLNVSVLNMKNEPIDVTLNLNDGSSAENGQISDNSMWETYFSFVPGDNYNLTISYNSTYTQNITIKTKNNKDIYVGFFDMTFQNPNAVYTNRTQDTYKLK